MPLTVYMLGASIFVLGTSEFMLAGLLPALAADLAVSIPDAGLLISAYAIGMLFGAPLFAAATLRLPRKPTLLSSLGVFAAGHVAGALAPTYGVLFASRVLSAVACAGFWAVATATTVALVPEERRGRALALVAGGLTLANVIGAPLGTFLGQHLGWRSAFWAVAVLALAAMGGVALLVGETRRAGEEPPRLRHELRAYRRPQVWLALGITVLTTAATMATFSYLAPLLTEAAGLASGWVPAVLALYGIGTLIGISLGGRLADVSPLWTLAAGLTGQIAVAAALALAGTSTTVAVAGALALGLAGFLTNPALNTRVFALAEEAPTLAGASNVTGFNIGIVLAPWVSGSTIEAGFGYLSVTWSTIAFGVVALGAVALAATLRRRTHSALQHTGAVPVTEAC